MTGAAYLGAVQDASGDFEQTAIHSIAPLSLYIHIPFCQSPCFYCGCNKIITRNRSAVREYLDHLRKEMALIRLQMGLYRRPVTQLHWGGGTPTFLDDAEMTELMHQTASYFHLTHDEHRDYSIEIDPRSVTNARIDLLRGLGFNRVSLGIQDFDEAVQQAVNRVQPFSMVQPLVEYIRARSFRSLNFDLIYGLPLQTPASLARTLDTVIDLGPDRISYYNYAHLPERFPAQSAIDASTLPSAEDKLQMLSLIIDKLTTAGYLYIGMDHFVKPDDPLALAKSEGRLTRNFQGYAVEKAMDLIGLGVSSISSVGNVYAQNATALDGYYKALDNNTLPVAKGLVCNAEDILRREIIRQISCYRELDTTAIERRFGINFASHFADSLLALRQLQADGLLVWSKDGKRMILTEQGSLLLRSVCMVFDEYLAARQSLRPAFSRVI